MRFARIGEPGQEREADVINTGTPAGVAPGRPGTPHRRPGDVVALEIDGLGRQQTLAQA